ncbi:hypothetical protein CCAX7_10660 [Capsulimonas corticalis]|uniref:chitinase n=1 Tax=Capsulimonas corticalis TaxID=2219043 RepID=A0A402CUL5_9BACT|nr:glycosyl hydrolase family 18 protein [Capsulimonas corticalis]BDI29015.1 hypothetical protein CCAX7_10660 [Capsulimonas corticalis]
MIFMKRRHFSCALALIALGVALCVAAEAFADSTAVTRRISPVAGIYNLTADAAAIDGKTAHLEMGDGQPHVGWWTDPKDTVRWDIRVPKASAGQYRIVMEYACIAGSTGAPFVVSAGPKPGQSVSGVVAETGPTWTDFRAQTLDGTVTLTPGQTTLRVTPLAAPGGAVMNLRRILLDPVKRAAPGKRKDFHIVAYLPEYRVMALNPELARYVTDLIFFSLSPTPEGGIDDSRLTPEMEAKLQEIKQRYHPRLEAAFGGGDRSGMFSAMATDPAKRKRFTQNLVLFCQKHGFDGIDYDWEFPNTPEEKAGLKSLILETKEAFAPHGLRLSMALATWDTIDPKALAACDLLNLMTYFDNTHHAPVAGAQADALGLVSKGAPIGKVCMGIPFYTETAVAMQDHREAPTYGELDKQTPLAANVDDADIFHFNGPETVRQKALFALGQGLGGVMIWELGQDTRDGALVRSIAGAVRGLPAASDTAVR